MSSPVLRLSDLQEPLAARLYGADVSFEHLSIDSRTIKGGELYVAIRGKRLDGHAFVQQAKEQGAVACVVQSFQQDLDLSQLVVADTTRALGQIAHLWRIKFSLPVVAVTGSCGKTTIKEMLTHVMLNHYQDPERVLATRGNLNNEYGVPLTLMRLKPQHRIAIIEMGANHQHEIQWLTQITRPDIAVVSNAGTAHIEGFGSREGIARGKGELYQNLKADAWAVINNDDDFADYWQSHRSNRNENLKTFAIEHAADVTARNLAGADNSHRPACWQVCSDKDKAELCLQVPGIHNVRNALATIATTGILGLKLASVCKALETFQNISSRLQYRSFKAFDVIDDTYNANPQSVQAAIDVLVSTDPQRKKIAILGDMGELGEQAASLHRQIGHYVAQKQVDQLFTIGPLSMHTHLACQQAGGNSQHFDDWEAAMKQLDSKQMEYALVLLKASRAMALERLIQVWEQEEQG